MFEQRVLLDLRGLALHAYFSGTDPDAKTSESGEELRTVAHTLGRFIELYLTPITREYSIFNVIAVTEGGNGLRRALFPEYKAKRTEKYSKEVADCIHASVNAVEKFCELLGILMVSSYNCEAEDTIAWLVQKLPGSKVIHSVDKDLIQLLDDEVWGPVRLFLKGQEVYFMTDKGIDVHPHHVALYKSIVGDAGDGYGGVPGIGPAGWTALSEIVKLDALVSVVNNGEFDLLLPGVEKHKVIRQLYEGREAWRLAWTLASLHPEAVDCSHRLYGQGVEAVYEYNRPRWVKALPQRGLVSQFMREHSAGYLIPSIEGLLPTKLLATRVTVNQQEVAGMVQAMQESSFVGFDLETWAPEQPAFMQAARGREYVDVLSSKIVGAGFTFGKHMEQTVYFSFDHAETSNLNLKLLDWILENIKKPLIIANVPFERTVIKNTRDIQLDDVIDIQPMISHWDENSEQGLKYSSSRILQYKQTEYRDVVAKGKTMRDYSAFHVFDYGADDPLCTVHIYQYLQTMLEIESTHEFVSAFEQPTLLQFSDAFLDGVTIDVEELERQKAEDEARLDVLMQEMRDLIKLNQTEEQIKAGADNLFSEAAAVLLAKQQQKAEREVDSDAESEPERHYSVMEEDELEPVLVEHHEPLLLEDSDERLQANLAKLHIDLISKVRYQDYRKVPKEHRFDITPGKLPDICGAFGLPPLADLKPATITDYLHEHAGKGTFVQDQFLAALHKCAQAKEFSPAKRGVAYQELRDFCYLYWFATLPEEKKFTWEGFEFNLGSPKQKELLLYGMLVLPYRLYNPKVSKTREALGLGGAPQTDKDAIADAIANVVAPEGDWRREVLMRLTEAQRCYTRLSLFYATLPLWVHPSTGNIHPGFRSCGTKTRRPSGSSPNLLQMPKRGDGVKIRKAILPNKRKGHNIVVSLDFVQEELMLLAGLSRDPNLFSCYSGEVVKDVHSMTTAPFAGMVLEQFEVARQTDKRLNDMRVNQGKATNFLSVYGGGAAKLSRKILRPQSEAKQWLEGFDQTYPGIRVWKERQIALLRQQGYLEDLLGARTHVYDRCKGRDESYRGSVDRQAISSQIQGLAAGIAKRVLSKLWEWKTFQRTGSTFYALVYDELVASLHHTQAITVISEMHAAMTMLVEGLGLPMRADISLGPSWGEQIECGREVNEERINAAIEKVLAK